MQIGRYVRRVTPQLDGDRGAALPMVLVVFLLSVLLVSAFMMAIVGSSQVSTQTRSGIQSQAAAEAGITAALVAIRTSGPCTAAVPVSTVPDYTVSITCNAAKTEVTVLSNGGSGSGQRQKIETVYQVETTGGGPMSIAGFYISHATEPFNGMKITTDVSPAPATIIAQGDFGCKNGGVSIPGDVYVARGNAYLENDCAVSGTIYVNGNFEDTTGGNKTLLGDIRATGNVILRHNLGTSAKRGNVYAGGNFETKNSGTISSGNVYAGGNVVIANKDINIFGDLMSRGTITGTPNSITGAKMANTAVPGSGVPSIETIPTWSDYNYDSVVWQKAGYTVEKWTAGSTQCADVSGSWSGARWQNVAAKTTNTVIDARDCGAVYMRSASTLSLNANIGLIAKSVVVDWGGTTIKSSSAVNRSFSIVTPDTVTNGSADCPAGSGKLIFRDVTVETSAQLNAYTPCGITISGSGKLRGGIFANGIGDGGSGGNLSVVPISLPGASFGSGSTSGAAGSVLGAAISQRNIK